MLNCLFAMLWIRPIDITFQLEGGYFYFNQLFDLDSNNCINGIANFHSFYNGHGLCPHQTP